MECVFCKIVKGELPSNKVFESEDFLAFLPLSKVWPVHVVCIPKKHIDKVDAIGGNEKVWDGLFSFAGEVIRQLELDKTGYRIVNNGAGYQGIDHEHIHILGGKDFKPKDGL